VYYLATVYFMDKDSNQHGLQNIWNMEIVLPHIITIFAWV